MQFTRQTAHRRPLRTLSLLVHGRGLLYQSLLLNFAFPKHSTELTNSFSENRGCWYPSCGGVNGQGRSTPGESCPGLAHTTDTDCTPIPRTPAVSRQVTPSGKTAACSARNRASWPPCTDGDSKSHCPFPGQPRAPRKEHRPPKILRNPGGQQVELSPLLPLPPGH